MDLASLEYFKELSKDLNMTRTAARLFLSQQTLSNHIRRLEGHYGTPLFHRKPALALNDAGLLVLAFAESVVTQESNLRGMLSDIASEQRGTLRVGAGALRGGWLLPQLAPKLHELHPGVTIDLRDGVSAALEAMVSAGELDFALVLAGDLSAGLSHRRLYHERIYVCIPDGLLHQHYSRAEARAIKDRASEGVDVCDIARLPLAVMSNRLGGRILASFARAGRSPNVYFSGTTSAQTLPLCAAGVAAAYCSQVSLLDQGTVLGDDVNVIALRDHDDPVFQEVHLVWHEDRHLTRYARSFMDLLQHLTQDLEVAPVGRIV